MDIFNEALNLVRRYEKGDAFRHHVRERMNLVAPVMVLSALISLVLCIGIMALMHHGGLRAFIAVVALPIVLIGSALLQIYIFFSWLELRALQPILAHGAAPAGGPPWLVKLRAKLGKAPPIPWVSVCVLLFFPFFLLLMASPKMALLVIVLAVGTPVAYAHLDR